MSRHGRPRDSERGHHRQTAPAMPGRPAEVHGFGSAASVRYEWLDPRSRHRRTTIGRRRRWSIGRRRAIRTRSRPSEPGTGRCRSVPPAPPCAPDGTGRRLKRASDDVRSSRCIDDVRDQGSAGRFESASYALNGSSGRSKREPGAGYVVATASRRRTQSDKDLLSRSRRGERVGARLLAVGPARPERGRWAQADPVLTSASVAVGSDATDLT